MTSEDSRLLQSLAIGMYFYFGAKNKTATKAAMAHWKALSILEQEEWFSKAVVTIKDLKENGKYATLKAFR